MTTHKNDGSEQQAKDAPSRTRGGAVSEDRSKDMDDQSDGPFGKQKEGKAEAEEER